MNKFFKLLMIAAIIIPCCTILVACGGKTDDNKTEDDPPAPETYVLPDVTPMESKEYSTKYQKPTVVVGDLVLNTDYTISWERKLNGETEFVSIADSSLQFKNAGEYRVTITGIGNYEGQTKTAIYVIEKGEYIANATNQFIGDKASDVPIGQNSILGSLVWDETDPNYNTPFVAGRNVRYAIYEGNKNYKANNHLEIIVTANRQHVDSMEEFSSAAQNENVSFIHINGSLTITQNIELPNKKTIVVPEGATLTIANGVSLYIKSAMNISGGTVNTNVNFLLNEMNSDLYQENSESYGDIIYQIFTATNMRTALTSGANIVQLQNDLESTTTINCMTPSNKEIICALDLNGFDIYGEVDISNKSKSTNKLILKIYNSQFQTNGSKIIASDSDKYGYGIVIEGNNNVSLYFENIDVEGYVAGIYTNGSYSDVTIKALNCKFTSTNSIAAYLPGNHEYTFTNCSFTGKTGYYVKSGVHVLTNCNITGNKDTYLKPSYNSNGASPSGDALVVEVAKGIAKDNLSVTINGGTFTTVAPDAKAVAKYLTAPEGETAEDLGDIIINSGNFSSDV